MDFLTLRDLAGVVRLAIERHTNEYWVVAEVAKADVNRKSGHCYLELIEKEEERTLAQMRAMIWARAYGPLNAEFRAATGRGIEAGMKLLVLARPVFHEVYGLSLNITAVDPGYTLGEMALRRRETVERLRKEGVAGLNKALALPPVVQRVAVVTSRTAAGYGDFSSRIKGSPYAFSVTLFEALMQGERAGQSIVEALKECARRAQEFDAVVVIRGGGAQSDLQCFDSYALAREIALMPLPVLTGIGHERDETVADMVANVRLITPTAVAQFLIDRARGFEDGLMALGAELSARASALLGVKLRSVEVAKSALGSALPRYLLARHQGLLGVGREFQHAVRHALHGQGERIERARHVIPLHVRALMRGRAEGLDGLVLELRHTALDALRGRAAEVERARQLVPLHTHAHLRRRADALALLEGKVGLLDPENVLRRGYSITTLNGKALTGSASLVPGAVMRTRLHRGSVISEVIKTED